MEDKDMQSIETLKHFIRQHESEIAKLKGEIRELNPLPIKISVIQLIATLALLIATVTNIIMLVSK